MPPLPESDPGTVPKGQHWVDMADEGTVLVIEQPPGQTCAAIGGIMAARMKVRGVKACVVGGRVRDLAELKASGLPVSFPLNSHLSSLLAVALCDLTCTFDLLDTLILFIWILLACERYRFRSGESSTYKTNKRLLVGAILFVEHAVYPASLCHPELGLSPQTPFELALLLSHTNEHAHRSGQSQNPRWAQEQRQKCTHETYRSKLGV